MNRRLVGTPIAAAAVVAVALASSPGGVAAGAPVGTIPDIVGTTTTTTAPPTTTTSAPPTTTTTAPIAPTAEDSMGVAYAEGAETTAGGRCGWGTVCQELDIFYWSDHSTKSRPTVLFIHQGAWAGGGRWSWWADQNGNPTIWAAALRSRGYVTASMSYDLNQGRRYRQQPADVANAVRWLKDNASAYGVDPDRIALFGASAGAHLALLHAMRHETTDELGVKAIVEWSGPTDLTALAAGFGCSNVPCYKDPVNQREGKFADQEDPRVAGWAVQGYTADSADTFPGGKQKHCLVDNTGSPDHPACPDHYVDGSPLAYVASGRAIPRMLLVHSPGDPVVPYDQLQRLLIALSNAGYGSETYQVMEPGACHGHGADPTATCTKQEMYWTGNNPAGQYKRVWDHSTLWLDRNL